MFCKLHITLYLGYHLCTLTNGQIPPLLKDDLLINKDRLRYWMDISGHALECFSSYLSFPSFSEATSKVRFSSIHPAYSVPQSPDLSFFCYISSLFTTFWSLLRIFLITSTQMTFCCLTLLRHKIFLMLWSAYVLRILLKVGWLMTIFSNLMKKEQKFLIVRWTECV